MLRGTRIVQPCTGISSRHESSRVELGRVENGREKYGRVPISSRIHTHTHIYGVEREIERERSAKNSKIPNEIPIIDHYKMRRDKKRETVPPLCIGRSTDSRRGAKIRAAWILRDINRKRNDRDERKEEEGRERERKRPLPLRVCTTTPLSPSSLLPLPPPPSRNNTQLSQLPQKPTERVLVPSPMEALGVNHSQFLSTTLCIDG